jgi:hypothetical protein
VADQALEQIQKRYSRFGERFSVSCKALRKTGSTSTTEQEPAMDEKIRHFSTNRHSRTSHDLKIKTATDFLEML